MDAAPSQRFRNALSYLLLIAAFGVLVPYLKGLEFFNPQLLAAYACMGTIFSGPAVAQALGSKPSSFSEAARWIVQAVLFGEGIVAAMLAAGILTVYLTHRHTVFFPPDVPALAVSAGLGVAISLALAAGAAWLALQFSPGAARIGLRIVFLALVALFFYRGQWLPQVAAAGTWLALGISALFLGLLWRRLQANAAA